MNRAMILLLLGVLLPSVGAANETLVDGIVAVVEGTPVLRSDLDALAATLERQGDEESSAEELLERAQAASIRWPLDLPL